jgi:hypothetical protein
MSNASGGMCVEEVQIMKLLIRNVLQPPVISSLLDLNK